MPHTFVTLVGTIWSPNQEERCNIYETELQTSQAKRDKPLAENPVTDKTTTCSKLFRIQADILQLLQTEETKTFIKRSFSNNKKLNASKEVKELPKPPQRSNSVRDKNHRKSMHRKHISLRTSQSTKIIFAQSKRRILHTKTAYSIRFTKVLVFNDQALSWCLMLDQGVCTAWQKAILSAALSFLSQFPVVKRD